MIKADIALADLAFDPVCHDGSLTLGASTIHPHTHAMLETIVVRGAGRWFVTVRERASGSRRLAGDRSFHVVDHPGDAEFDSLYRESLLWPLDYVMIEAAQAGHRLRIRAGLLGSVPVYCQVIDDRVFLSWDSSDFAARPAMIDLEVASHQLALRTMYAARQLYTGVVLLTERACMHIEPGRAQFRYPEAIVEHGPAPEDGEDTLPRFAEALQRVVALRPWATGGASLELSGGMDSATVATALTRRHGDIDSKGILLDGDVRAPQVRRRGSIVDRLGLSDHTVDIAAYPPTVDLRTSHGPLGFSRDFYIDACSALWSSARDAGRDVLFTGIGGDELFPAYVGEVADDATMNPAWGRDARGYAEALLTPQALNAARSWPVFEAPATAVPATALLAHACRAPDLLKHGQWPVNPLSDPHLAAFCQRLPRSSREGREVMRRYLESHLGPDVFPKGYLKETFANVLPPLVAKNAPVLTAQLRECALADLGLVDRDAVLELLATIVATRAHPATSAFASFLWLERCARQASGRAVSSPEVSATSRAADSLVHG